MSPERQLKAVKQHAKRLANLSSKAKSEASVVKLFSQLIPSQFPLDLGDDCAEILRAAWDARRNHAQEITEMDIVRLCAAFRAIGKAHP